jgi:hypothetical protein
VALYSWWKLECGSVVSLDCVGRVLLFEELHSDKPLTDEFHLDRYQW